MALLDEYVREPAVKFWSATVKQAIDLLRAADLAGDYAAAWTEWDASDDKARWEQATHDGLTA